MQKSYVNVPLSLPFLTEKTFWILFCLIELTGYFLFELMIKLNVIRITPGSILANWNAISFIGYLAVNFALYLSLKIINNGRRKRLRIEIQNFLVTIDDPKNIDNVYRTLSNDSETQHLVKRVRDYCQIGQWQNAYDVLDKEDLHQTLIRYGESELLLDLCQSLLVNNIQWSSTQMADIYNVAGIASSQIRKLPDALKYFQLSLQQADGTSENHCVVMATALSGQGLIYMHMGQLQNAITYQLRALFAIQETKNKKSEANILLNLGHLYYRLHKHRKAFEFYNYALKIAYQLANQEIIVNSLNYIGKVYYKDGHIHKALKCYKLAIHAVKEINYSEGKASVFNNLAFLCKNLYLQPQTIICYEYALKISESIKNDRGKALTLYNLGIEYWSLKQFDEAIRYLGASLNICKSLSDVETEVIILHKLGEIYLAQNRFEVSLACILFTDSLQVDNTYVGIGRQILSLLKEKIGDRKYAQLLAHVEPRAQQIVDEALSHSLPDESD